MSLLLVLPAVGIVLFLGRGFMPAIRLLVLMLQIQAAIAAPSSRATLGDISARAFEFSRQFFFKWTVNWRFLGEDLFLDRNFHVALLVLHVTTLLFFIGGRWLRPTRKPLIEMIMPFICGESMLTEKEEKETAQRVTPQYILTTILTANMIGLLFARSLHYQFYAYSCLGDAFSPVAQRYQSRSPIWPLRSPGMGLNVYPQHPLQARASS